MRRAWRGRPVSAAPSPDVLAAMLGRLREPEVRDLAWLLLAPTPPLAAVGGAVLAEPVDAAALSRLDEWLDRLDAAPAALREALAVAPGALHRLGVRAERLLRFYLESGPGPRMIAANVPVVEAGRTLGECDFLVETADARRLHWEMSVKFYLRVFPREPPALSDYVGTNINDRFDLKVRRLLGHQLKMAAMPAVQRRFPGWWQPQMLLRAWLFEPPAHMGGRPDAAARWLTSDAWLDGAQCVGKHVAGYSVLRRIERIAPVRVPVGVLATRGALDAGLHAHFARSRCPQLVAACAAHGDAAVEVARYFLVPPEWVGPAQAFAAVDIDRASAQC
jgi:hypothetical protein